MCFIVEMEGKRNKTAGTFENIFYNSERKIRKK